MLSNSDLTRASAALGLDLVAQRDEDTRRSAARQRDAFEALALERAERKLRRELHIKQISEEHASFETHLTKSREEYGLT